VKEKIAFFLRSRKGQDMLLVLAVILLGVVSFGLGRLSNEPENARPVVLRVPVSASVQASIPASGDYDLPAGDRVSVDENPVNATPATEKQYVASKNGSVYHLPWCSGAQRIKEENKVWFATKEAAQAAGLRPAANCKGI